MLENEFQTIEIMVNNIKMPLSVNINSLRTALGLPNYALKPPFRPPLNVSAPAEDIEDIDHQDSDQEM